MVPFCCFPLRPLPILQQSFFHSIAEAFLMCFRIINLDCLCIVIFLSGNPVYSMFNNEFLILLPIKRSYVVEFSTTEDNCGISGSKRYFLLENGIHKIYNGDSCVKLCCILIHFITCLYRLIVSVSFGAELRSYLKKIAAYMNLLYIVMHCIGIIFRMEHFKFRKIK